MQKNAKESKLRTLEDIGRSSVATGRVASTQRPHPSEIYQPLSSSKNQIRVLKILPDLSSVVKPHLPGIIQCILEHVSLDDNPKYHAVSYAWEDLSLGQRFENPDAPPQLSDGSANNWINIDSLVILDGQRIEVTKNLWLALWHFRRSAQWHVDHPRARVSEFGDYLWNRKTLRSVYRAETWLWIDALCINQEDVRERNDQVQHMTDVYRKADCVHVWLGPAFENLHLVAQMAFWVKHHKTPHEGRAFKSSQDKKRALLEWIRDPLYEKHFEALITIHRRPYWRRLWVVQELLLNARTPIHIGLRLLPFDSLMLISQYILENYLSRLGGTGPDSPTQLERVVTKTMPRKSLRQDKQAYKDGGSGHSLFDLLKKYRHQECADPKDYVYALLGLAESSITKYSLTVNYASSVEDVYKEAAKYTILCSNKLDIICNSEKRVCDCNLGQHKAPSLPSWVPNWQCRREGVYLFNGNSWKASGDRFCQASISPDGEAITCKGLLLGSIERLQLFDMLEYAEPNDIDCILKHLEPFIEHLSSQLFAASVADARSKASQIVYDTLFGSKPTRSLGMPYGTFMRRMSGLEEDIDASNPYPSCVPGKGGAQFLRKELESLAILNISVPSAHILYNTPAPLIEDYAAKTGLSYQFCEQGDIVCILYGCKYPVVLREVVTAANKYSLIGVAYVHGFMMGEALKHPWSMREFAWEIV